MEFLVENIEKIILPVVDSHDCRLVDIVFRREGKGKVLRLFLESLNSIETRGSGVTVDQCASVSRDISLALDTSEVFDEPYTLEVSSAGLDRPLRRIEDYGRFVGSKVRIRTSVPIMKQRSFTGKLEGVNHDVILITVKDSETVEIPINKIKKANLVPEIKWK